MHCSIHLNHIISRKTKILYKNFIHCAYILVRLGPLTTNKEMIVGIFEWRVQQGIFQGVYENGIRCRLCKIKLYRIINNVHFIKFSCLYRLADVIHINNRCILMQIFLATVNCSLEEKDTQALMGAVLRKIVQPYIKPKKLNEFCEREEIIT